MTIDPALDPQTLGDGQLSVLIDGRRFTAFVEDDVLYVVSKFVDGQQLPTPRAGFIVRVDSTATLELTTSL